MIKIDTREQELFTKMEHLIQTEPKFKSIKLVSQTLPLGDMIIHDGTNDCIIIERKTLSDLSASIKDGRYREQSYRLNGLQHHNHNIIYLIEGDMNKLNTFKERIDKQTLYSAMFSIYFFKGFSLMRSFNMDETAMITCNMVYKLVNDLKDGKVPYYSNSLTNPNTSLSLSLNLTPNPISEAPKNNEVEVKGELNNESDNNDNSNANANSNANKEYCSVVKKVKKDNVTEENIGEIMLSQIPGVSSVSALAILSHFKTLPNLIKSIQEDENCLNNICTVDPNGKSRKISKSAIATIIKFLRH